MVSTGSTNEGCGGRHRSLRSLLDQRGVSLVERRRDHGVWPSVVELVETTHLARSTPGSRWSVGFGLDRLDQRGLWWSRHRSLRSLLDQRGVSLVERRRDHGVWPSVVELVETTHLARSTPGSRWSVGFGLDRLDQRGLRWSRSRPTRGAPGVRGADTRRCDRCCWCDSLRVEPWRPVRLPRRGRGARARPLEDPPAGPRREARAPDPGVPAASRRPVDPPRADGRHRARCATGRVRSSASSR